VVGDEGTSRRTAGDRLHHRRLDLDEPSFFEEAAYLAHGRRARREDTAGLGVRREIQIALAGSLLAVLQPVPLLRPGCQRFGQHRDALGPHRELVGPGAEERTLDPPEVTEVEGSEQRERLLSEGVTPEMDLEPPVAVREVNESGLAVAPHRGDPPADPDPDRGRLQ